MGCTSTKAERTGDRGAEGNSSTSRRAQDKVKNAHDCPLGVPDLSNPLHPEVKTANDDASCVWGESDGAPLSVAGGPGASHSCGDSDSWTSQRHHPPQRSSSSNIVASWAVSGAAGSGGSGGPARTTEMRGLGWAAASTSGSGSHHRHPNLLLNSSVSALSSGTGGAAGRSTTGNFFGGRSVVATGGSCGGLSGSTIPTLMRGSTSNSGALMMPAPTFFSPLHLSSSGGSADPATGGDRAAASPVVSPIPSAAGPPHETHRQLSVRAESGSSVASVAGVTEAPAPADEEELAVHFASMIEDLDGRTPELSPIGERVTSPPLWARDV